VLKVKRQQMLNHFISTIKENNDIDAKEFWKFREFYSPGFFTHNEINVNYIQPFVIVDNQKTSKLDQLTCNQ